MWIDVNAHVGHCPFKRLRYNTCATLLERMDRFAFGSHSPILDYLTGRLRIEALRPSEAGEAAQTHAEVRKRP